LPDALPRREGDAAPRRRLLARRGLHRPQPPLDDRRVHHRARNPRLHRQRVRLAAQARALRRRSVGGAHARVVHELAAAAAQLPVGGGDPLVRAQLRLRPPRGDGEEEGMKDRVPIESVWIGGFGLWMGVLATILWLWNGDELAPILLTGAAAAMVLLALYTIALRARPIETRLLGDASLPTVVLVFGIAMMVNGAEFGLWLVLIGA